MKDAQFIRRISLRSDVPEVRINECKQQTGLNGCTPLFRLPYFSYTENVGIDVMHNVILGWVKEVTTELVDPFLRSNTQTNRNKVPS